MPALFFPTPATFQPKLWTPLQAAIYFPYPKFGSQEASNSEFDDDFDFFDDDQQEERSPDDEWEQPSSDDHETSPKHTEL